MAWQDVTFGIGGLIFLLALIPSVLRREPPALITCLMTSTVLSIFAITYVTLDYYFAATNSILTAGVWLILAHQRAFPGRL